MNDPKYQVKQLVIRHPDVINDLNKYLVGEILHRVEDPGDGEVSLYNIKWFSPDGLTSYTRWENEYEIAAFPFP